MWILSFGRSWCTVPLRHKVQIPIKPLTPAGSNLACCGSHISVSCPVPGDIPSPFFSSAIRPDRIACSVRLMPTLIKTERKKERERVRLCSSISHGPFPTTHSISILTDCFYIPVSLFYFQNPWSSTSWRYKRLRHDTFNIATSVLYCLCHSVSNIQLSQSIQSSPFPACHLSLLHDFPESGVPKLFDLHFYLEIKRHVAI